MLKLDYWDKELTSNQPVWDTSQLIRKSTTKSDLIISVTGGDPTLLYLSNRKGWLLSPNQINEERILQLKEDGAKYVAGSWSVIESYNKFPDEALKSNLKNLLCSSFITVDSSTKGCREKDNSYLIDLN